MKKASRFMPKIGYSESGLRDKVILGSFITFFVSIIVWVINETPILLALVPVVTACIVMDTKKRKKHFSKLQNDRVNLSICNFARSFDCHVVDTWLIRGVYEEVQDYLGEAPGLGLKATDKFADDLLLESDDIDDIIEIVAVRSGRSLDNYETNPYFGKVLTLGDAVYFLNCQPLEVNAT